MIIILLILLFISILFLWCSLRLAKECDEEINSSKKNNIIIK